MVAVAPSLLAVDDAQVTQAQSNPVAPEDNEQWQPLDLAEHPRTSSNVVDNCGATITSVSLSMTNYPARYLTSAGMLDSNRSCF